MRGLLVKEFIVVRKTMLVILLLAVGFVVMKLTDPLLVVPLFTLVLCNLEINTMYNDELSKWQAYSLALPFERRTIVISKYVEIALTAVAMGILGMIVSFIFSLMGIGSPEQGIIYSLLAITCGFIYSAVVLPFFYVLSMTKGRMVLMVINTGSAGGVIGLASGADLSAELFEGASLSFLPGFLIIIAAVFILFAVSCFISTKIYERRSL